LLTKRGGRSRSIRPQKNLALYKSFNRYCTLWTIQYHERREVEWGRGREGKIRSLYDQFKPNPYLPILRFKRFPTFINSKNFSQ
jgi:hypothetical protein